MDPFAVIFSIDIVVSVMKSKQISLFKQWSLMTIRRKKADGIDYSLIHMVEGNLRWFWHFQWYHKFAHCTKVQFASFQSGRFITVIVMNPPASKQAKHTSVHCTKVQFASFQSCGFITVIEVNLPKSKLAKHTSVQCGPSNVNSRWTLYLKLSRRTLS